jgi:hypothetical protein
MKTPQLLRSAVIIAVGVVGGTGLGYFQDDLTQRYAPRFVHPFGTIIYVGVPLAWIGFVIWYGLALRFAAARRLGILPSPNGFLFLLTWWLCTIGGGTAFFLINGMDYMTLVQVIFLSTWLGSAYSCVFIALPLLALSVVRTAFHRPVAAAAGRIR